MTIQKELIKNTLVIAAGKVSTQFLTLLLLPLYTAYLATNEFGTVDLIMTYVSLLAPLITVQLEMSAFRFLIDARGDEAEIRKIISSITRTVGLVAIVGIAVLAGINTFIDIPHVWLIAATIAAVMTANMLLQITRGFGDNIKYSIASVAGFKDDRDMNNFSEMLTAMEV